MKLEKVAIVPVVIIVVLVGLLIGFGFYHAVFNPPYLRLILNIIFITSIGFAVAFLSARSFLRHGSLNILLIGSGLLISGLTALASGAAATLLSANANFTIFAVGMFFSSITLVFSTVFFVTSTPKVVVNRKIVLSIAYMLAAISVTVLTALVILKVTPAFVTEAGTTPLRSFVLGVSAVFFILSGLISASQYLKLKSQPLYWYSLAIFLYAVGLSGAFEAVELGDVLQWVSRIALYVGGIYFLLMLWRLSQTEGFENLSESWTETFSNDRKQFSDLFSKMLDAFSYSKIVTDSGGKPVDFVFLEVNDAFEKSTGLKKEDILGKKATQVLSGIEKASFDWIGIFGTVALSGEHVHFENYMEPLKKWFTVSAYSPRKGYFVAIFEDVTERKQAEMALSSSEQRWATTLASIGDAVIATDVLGNILYMNGEAEELTGWVLSEASQKPLKTVFNIINEQSRLEVENPIERVLKEGVVVGLANHTVLIKRDGTDVAIDDSGAPIKDKEGKTTGVVLIFRDITERKKAEGQILEQLHMLDLAHVIVKNMKDEIIFWNAGAQKLYGFSKEEALGKIPRDLLKTKFPIPLEQIKEELLRTGKWEGELVHQKADGSYISVASHWVLHRDNNGKPVAIIEVNNDITERIAAEKALQESEQRWATTLASIGDAVIATDQSGKITFMNDDAEELTGWTLSEAVQKPVKTVFNIINEQTRLEVENPIERVLKEGMVVGLANHTVLIRKDGTEIPVDDSGSPIKDKYGNTTGVVLIFRDITERKKTEEQIARLASFPTLNPNPIVEMDFDGKIEYINPAAKAIFVDIETLGLNHPFFASWKSATKAFAEKTANTFNCEVKIGDDWYLQNYSNVPNAQRIRVYALNITESKKAEEAIKQQAELIDLTPAATIVRSLNGTISFWSKGAEKLYGWTKEEAIGQNINSLLKTESSQHLEDVMDKLKLDGKWSGEIVHICKDGSKVAEQSFWLARFDGDGKIFEVLESNTDITERVELQLKLEESAVRVEEYANQMEDLAEKRAEQLKDAERLAAIGATAGMVGHDIRNPLQAITGDIYLAKTELEGLPDSEEKKAILESLIETEKNVDYINKIVQDLQDFARPLNPNPCEADLKFIIDRMLAKNHLPENVKVTVKVHPDARKIVADSDYLTRILYNLVTNAVQAMPKGGKLTIQTYKEANDVILAVKDTGVGIPEAVRGKLFTPMFTTKSKGQGFGLPVVKRMTESLGGAVTFESKVGKGTTFTVHLPPKGAKR